MGSGMGFTIGSGMDLEPISELALAWILEWVPGKLLQWVLESVADQF